MYVMPLHCCPKPKICRLKPATSCPAQVRSRQGPVTYSRPEPPYVVTDIAKRDYASRDWPSILT